MELHVQKVEPTISGQKYVQLLNPENVLECSEQELACMRCYTPHKICFDVYAECFCFGV